MVQTANRDLIPGMPFDFAVGCNYWASHAGTAMWSDWQQDIVAADLERLAAIGVQVLRVFPLWSEFQPIVQLYGGAGNAVEVRFGELPLPDDEAGRAGVSRLMVERLRTLLDLAAGVGLRVIVSLITGWMSGRLFVPPALAGSNLLTDPVALMWQTRLVRYLVTQLRDHSAISAWDLGNECNVMGKVPGREAAWHWSATIANAIRAADPSRPVLSGMHSLSLDGIWRIEDQGELTDVVTTHPYPLWTPYSGQDPLLSMRALLHATCESRLYSDLSGRPCIVEEIGTMGPMITDERGAADFLRLNLLSLWLHDLRGLLWWSAFDQNQLAHAPYDWVAVERELGLLHADGRPKPVAAELNKFSKRVATLPGGRLPAFQRDALCVLSADQDHWAVAYGAFVLAKQAGFDIQFQSAERPLSAAPLYLLPAISGHRVIPRRRWQELLDRVAAGATLYISHQDGFLSEFEQLTGLQIHSRSVRDSEARFSLDDLGRQTEFTLTAPIRLGLSAGRATVLAAEPDGNPVLTCAPYGRGQVLFCSLAPEASLTQRPGAFHRPEEPPYWQLYQRIAQISGLDRIVSKTVPQLGITEHIVSEQRRYVAAINYSAAPLQTHLQLHPEWRLEQVVLGAANPDAAGRLSLNLDSCDAAIIVCARLAGAAGGE